MQPIATYCNLLATLTQLRPICTANGITKASRIFVQPAPPAARIGKKVLDASPAAQAAVSEIIKHVNEQGQEYWTARELQPVLEYKQWRQFSDVIDKAKAACDTSKIKVSDHFADVRKIVKATFAVKLLSYGIDPVDGFTVRETAAVYGIPREYADMLQKCLFA